MNKKNYALAVSPLSRSFLEDLEKKTGEKYEILIAGSLRQLGLRRLFFTLRALSVKSLVIAVEDPETLLILPALTLLSLPIRASNRQLFLSDKKITSLNYKTSLLSAVKFFFICGYMQISRLWLDLKMKRLLSIAKPVEKKIHGKKILYINENFWFGIKAGGSVGHIAGVINGLQKQGYEVAYAALSDNKMLNNPIKKISLPFLKIFAYPGELNYSRFSNLAVKTLSSWIKDNKPDFIYQRMSLGNFSGVILSQRWDIPLILEYNGSEVWCAEKWGKGLRYKSSALLTENLNIRQASRIVTISDALKEELENRGVAENKIVCYPNCVDAELFNPEIFTTEDSLKIRRRHHIKENALLLTFLGTFGKWHGVDILAQLIKNWADEKRDWMLRHQIHFLLVGDGAQMPQVKSILNSSDYLDFVTFAGLVPQDQGPAHLFASDILLSPHVANADNSAFFGSPTKLFEYMAMGKGIIASNLGQIGKVLKNSLTVNQLQNDKKMLHETAVLCEPGNLKELEQAIIYLVENPQIRRQLGENARKEALLHYTWDNHVNKILDSLHSI